MNLKNKTILIIGASNKVDKYGYKIYNDLKDKNMKIIPINYREERIQNDKAFDTIDEFMYEYRLDPEEILLNFVVPPKASYKITKAAIENGFKYFWYQPGAYSKKIELLHEVSSTINIHDKCIMIETD